MSFSKESSRLFGFVAGIKFPKIIQKVINENYVKYFNIDMSAAVENLLLEADALGLGAVWMGISPDQGRMEAVAKALNLPEKLHAFALVPCGYPAEERPQEDRYDPARVHYVGEELI